MQLAPGDPCGCACHAGGDAAKEELEAPLLDLETGAEHATTPTADGEGATTEWLAAAFTKIFVRTDAEREEAERSGRWVLRGFLVLLWLYLVNLMRIFVITNVSDEYTGLVVLLFVLIAMDLASLFCAIGMGLEPTDGHHQHQPVSPPPSELILPPLISYDDTIL